jgi:hypothetical protein
MQLTMNMLEAVVNEEPYFYRAVDVKNVMERGILDTYNSKIASLSLT